MATLVWELKLCNYQKGLPWGTKPKFRFCLLAIKGIQCLKDLWDEDGSTWQSLRHIKRIICLKNATDKKATFIQSVSWNMKKSTPPFKLILGQWKVLDLPQANLHFQELYHVEGERMGNW
jgi:hypothetical protein